MRYIIESLMMEIIPEKSCFNKRNLDDVICSPDKVDTISLYCKPGEIHGFQEPKGN